MSQCPVHNYELVFYGFVGSAGGDLPGEDWRCLYCETERLEKKLSAVQSQRDAYKKEIFQIADMWQSDGLWGAANTLRSHLESIPLQYPTQ